MPANRILLTSLLSLLLITVAACKGGGQPSSVTIVTTQFGTPTRSVVELWDSAGQQMISETQSDARGTAELLSVEPGRYMLRFREPGGRSFAAQRQVNIGSAQRIQMEVELTERGSGSDPVPAGDGEGQSGAGEQAQPAAGGRGSGS